MKEITLTINGKQVKGKEGDTVLDVCLANGVEVPTLCHYKGLSDIGACRLCIVDIERERRPVPACTYPARDGLVIETHNEKLEKYRRLILELMFTERNHLCAHCVASGDCELQNLAYKYQMDHTRYPYSWPILQVDSVSNYLVIDHNRCILCGRCVRTCDEIVGIHTLDFGNRGWKDTIVADLNQPLGNSSCISCGACFQVCPTGAIFSKASAYKGRPDECKKVSSVCPICGIGCQIVALVKDDRLVRIDSPNLTDTRGILCHKVRFDPLYMGHKRVKTALVRNRRGKLEPCATSEAIEIVGKKLNELKARYGSDSIVGIASSQADNESLKAFKRFITDTVGSDLLDSLDGDDFRVISQGIRNFEDEAGLNFETSAEEILKADCVVVAGANPLQSHPVIGSYILRATRQNKANLIAIDSAHNPFFYYTTLWLKPKRDKLALALDILTKTTIDTRLAKNHIQTQRIAASLKDIDLKRDSEKAGVSAAQLLRAAELLGKSQHTVVVYGEGILQHRNAGLITSLINLAAVAGSQNVGKPNVLSLKPRGNSYGAWNLGIANPSETVVKNLARNRVKALYLLLADEYVESPQLQNLPKAIEFVVVQSSYLSPVISKANVVLPSPIWSEMGAQYTTLDGISMSTSPVIRPTNNIPVTWEIIQQISRQFEGKK